MEDVVVILIVVLAGAYLGRTLYRRRKGARACGCGCSSCDAAAKCDNVTPKDPLYEDSIPENRHHGKPG